MPNTDAELIAQLRERIADLERENANLHSWIADLREAIDALMQPAPSELLAKNLAHPSRQ